MEDIEKTPRWLKLSYVQHGKKKSKSYCIGYPAPGLDHLHFQQALDEGEDNSKLTEQSEQYIQELKKAAAAENISLRDYLERIQTEGTN